MDEEGKPIKNIFQFGYYYEPLKYNSSGNSQKDLEDIPTKAAR